MYGIIEVGKYNVDYEGSVYENKKEYEMVIFEEFNGNTPVKNTRKTLYFRKGNGFIIPEFKTEKEVEKYLKYKNKSRVIVEMMQRAKIE